jgi:hypothetical protein
MEAAAYPSPAVITATERSPRLWSFPGRLSAGGIPDELVCRHGDAPATRRGPPGRDRRLAQEAAAARPTRGSR